jgi:hypothetical protein
MDFMQKVWTGVLLTVVVGVIVVVAFWPRADASEAGPTPSSTATAEIGGGYGTDGTGSPTPEPTVGGEGNDPTSDSTDSPSNTNAPENDPNSIDGTGGEPAWDQSAHRQAAAATVAAYATVKPGESVSARAARLAPYFPEGSRYLTEPPRIANPQNQSGIVATVTPTSAARAGLGERAANGGHTFQVVMSYEATYEREGQVMHVVKTATWTVTSPASFNGQFAVITEPENLN